MSAMKQLLRAAETGDAGSQFNLGIVYGNLLDQSGHGTPENRAQAIKWLRLAAEQDLPRAQLKLAQFLAEQIDSPETGIEACAWFLRAMAKLPGMYRENAQKGFGRLAAQLTPEQVDEARSMAQGPMPAGQDAGGDTPKIKMAAR